MMAGLKSLPKPASQLIDNARFVGAWLRNPKKTGAVAPSSPQLGALMASYVNTQSDGVVVELGPGTGPVTAELLKHGVKPERLYLIEYSLEFVHLLRKRFPGVHVIHGDAYAIGKTLRAVTDRPVDAVVSSLPLLTRPETVRSALVREAVALGPAHTPFIQFTYGHRPPAPDAGFKIEKSRTIWRNLPPARVFVYRA
jgi:phosphatidylethanolamine/phosphatidyl-N-methylethanolamine N-methyltransferase